METNGIPLEMKVDTGASLSLVAEDMSQCHWANRELQQFQFRLCIYILQRAIGSDGEHESETTSWWPRLQSSTAHGEGKWAKSPRERLAGISANRLGASPLDQRLCLGEIARPQEEAVQARSWHSARV